jgi:hypothetical protein
MEKALAAGDWHPYSGVGFYMAPRPDVGIVQAHMQHSSQVPALYTHDAWDLTEIEVKCLQQVKIAIYFFKKYMPGFKNAYVTRICNEARLREGRRVICDYYLTTDDVVAGKRFYDVIVSPGSAQAVTSRLDENADRRYFQTDRGRRKPRYPYRCLCRKKWRTCWSRASIFPPTGTRITGSCSRQWSPARRPQRRRPLREVQCDPRELEAEIYINELQDVLKSQGAILDSVH